MAKFILKENGHTSLMHLRGYIGVGATGEIIATRKLDEDVERCYLVKFKGVRRPRHVQESWGVVIK